MQKRNPLGITVLLVGLGMGPAGCANHEVTRLQKINETQAARIEQLNQDVSMLTTTADRKQTRIEQLEGEMGDIRSVGGNLETELSDLQRRQASLQNALGTLQLVALDPGTDGALRQLAEDNSEIIGYDSSRALIMFTSDQTFASGSDEIKPQAREVLMKLASIMNESRAGTYDLRIIGHTDNQRMSNPATIRRFGSNRHLSFFRAASVEKILREAGMPGQRLETVGWGEYRPLVPNSTRGGTSENRRVEIFVVGTSEPTSTTPETQTLSGVADEPAQQDDRLPMK